MQKILRTTNLMLYLKHFSYSLSYIHGHLMGYILPWFCSGEYCESISMLIKGYIDTLVSNLSKSDGPPTIVYTLGGLLLS